MYLHRPGNLGEAQIGDFPSSHCVYSNMTCGQGEDGWNDLDRKSELVLFFPSRMTAGEKLRVLEPEGDLDTARQMPVCLQMRTPCLGESGLLEVKVMLVIRADLGLESKFFHVGHRAWPLC